MFTVVVTEKEGPERRVTFTESEVTIGRVPGNDVVLPKGNVSKRHSRIVLKDNRFIVVDLKSTNGTYVNGRKITSPLVVKEGDKIYVGDYVLTLESAPPDLDGMKAPSMLPTQENDVHRTGAALGVTQGGRAPDSPADDVLPAVLRGTLSNSSMPSTSVGDPDEISGGHEPSGPGEQPVLAAESELSFEDRSSREQERPPDLEPPAFSLPLDARARRDQSGAMRAGDNTTHDSLLGPIELVLSDPEVMHVVVERYDRIRADRGSGLKLESASFSSPDSLLAVALSVGSVGGAAASAASYDVVLPSGVQVVAVLPGAATSGPMLSVRRRPLHALSLGVREEHEGFPHALTTRIEQALRERRHLWLVGPSPSALAGFLSSVLASCPADERVAVLERAPELALGERSAICLKLGALPVRELLDRARAFRPDRLVAIDVREDELSALLPLFAQQPHGHLAAFEARSAQDALHTFVAAAGAETTLRAAPLMIELRPFGNERVLAAYELSLDADGELALRAV